MGSSEGVKRGLEVDNTGATLFQVPVGVETLGRIMDVLGNPIDECGPIGEQERRAYSPQDAPAYDELASVWWIARKPVSKLSTWFAHSPRVVKLVCSVVPVLVKP